MFQLPNPTDIHQNVIYLLYTKALGKKCLLWHLPRAVPKRLRTAAVDWELSSCLSPEHCSAALQGQSKIWLCRDLCPEVVLPGSYGGTSWLESSLCLEQSASVIGALASEQSQESAAAFLSAGMFIMSLLPSRLALLMRRNIQNPCSLVKWILVMELHYEVFLVEKTD